MYTEKTLDTYKSNNVTVHTLESAHLQYQRNCFEDKKEIEGEVG